MSTSNTQQPADATDLLPSLNTGGTSSASLPPGIPASRNPTSSDHAAQFSTWANGTTIWMQTKKNGGSVWTALGSGTLGAVITITGDVNGAEVPLAGNFSLLGTANQIRVTGGANKETFSLIGPYTPATFTAHGVLIGEGTSSIAATTAGTTGQVLIGSTGADPAFGALGLNSGLTVHGVVIAENNSAFVATTAGTTGQVLIGSTAADPAFGALGLNSGLTAHGVILGENNSAFVATTAGTNGQVLVGGTAADPAFATITSAGATLAFTLGSNTLAMDVQNGSFTVVDQISGSATLAKQTQYITDNGASLVTYTLPLAASATQGMTYKVRGFGSGGWKIAQNALQTIHYNSTDTTTGVAGSLASTNRYNCVTLVCLNNTGLDFVVADSSGTLTVA